MSSLNPSQVSGVVGQSFETKGAEGVNRDGTEKSTKKIDNNTTVGVIRELSGDNILKINNMPEEIELERTQPDKSGENNEGEDGEKIKPDYGPIKLNLELKFTSIKDGEYIGLNKTQSSNSENNSYESPFSASKKLEELSLPIKPISKESKLKSLSKLPRLVEIRLPYVTEKFDREIMIKNQSGEEKSIDNLEDYSLNNYLTKVNNTFNDLEEKGFFNEDNRTKSLEEFADNTRKRQRERTIARFQDEVYRKTSSFVGYIDELSETRKNFNSNNTHQELIADLTIIEVPASELKKYADVYESALWRGEAKAIRKRTVNRYTLSHGTKENEAQHKQEKRHEESPEIYTTKGGGFAKSAIESQQED